MKRLQNNLESITDESTDSSVVVVARDGDIFYKVASTGVSYDTQFYIGSVSKHMTAYMMLVSLHEKYPEIPLGKLLDEKLDVLFQGSQLLKSIAKEWISEVSLLDLLTHRSGIEDKNLYSDDDLVAMETFSNPIDATELLKLGTFNPEKKWAYSNLNYLLTAKLIEELQNDTLDNVFEKIIKVPVGMKSSFCPVIGNYSELKATPDFTDLAPNKGTFISDKLGRAFIDMSHIVGSGGVISTSADLIKWGNYLFKVAPKEIVDVMLKDYGTSDVGRINLGLFTKDSQLGKLIYHDGHLEPFSTNFRYAPESDTMIIMLNNNEAEFEQLQYAVSSWLTEVSLDMHAEKLIWSWTKELLEENECRAFAKAYNEAYPYAEENGYGPLALIVYDSSNLSGDEVSDSDSLA